MILRVLILSFCLAMLSGLSAQTVQEKKKLFLDKVLPVVQKVYAQNKAEGKYAHPISITLAQAAMESAWGTSRFYREATNIFGVWAYNKNTPRIAAKQKRNGKTIWLRKYTSLEESVRDYYANISKSRVYKKFRELNKKDANVYDLVKELRMYSEKRDVYVKELAQIIRYNKFTKYDAKR